MEAFDKESVPKDMHVKPPKTLLQVAYVANKASKVICLRDWNNHLMLAKLVPTVCRL